MNRRNNSVIVLAIFFVCATTGLAQGSTMVDNFDYGSTTDTPISTGAAGDGWAGGWTGSNPRSGSYLPGGQLEYAGTGYNNALNPATTGGVGGLASNDANASAISDRAFTANQTGVVWISALAKFDAGTPDGETLVCYAAAQAPPPSFRCEADRRNYATPAPIPHPPKRSAPASST